MKCLVESFLLLYLKTFGPDRTRMGDFLRTPGVAVSALETHAALRLVISVKSGPLTDRCFQFCFVSVLPGLATAG